MSTVTGSLAFPSKTPFIWTRCGICWLIILLEFAVNLMVEIESVIQA